MAALVTVPLFQLWEQAPQVPLSPSHQPDFMVYIQLVSAGIDKSEDWFHLLSQLLVEFPPFIRQKITFG